MTEHIKKQPTLDDFFKLPDFLISDGIIEQDVELGLNTSEIIGESKVGAERFSVTYTRGFGCKTAIDPPKTVVERDVLYVDYVGVTEGQGLGTSATRGILELARFEGFELVRMGIVDPRMAGVVEKLFKEGSISERFYKLERGIKPKPDLPTAKFPTNPELVTPETVIRELEEADAAIQQDDSLFEERFVAAQCLISL